MRFALITLVLFGASLIRSVFGFGDALFAMPLMSFVVGVSTATPVMGLISLVIAVGVLLTYRRHVDISAVWRLVVASLIGIPVGVLMLNHFPSPGEAIRVSAEGVNKETTGRKSKPQEALARIIGDMREGEQGDRDTSVEPASSRSNRLPATSTSASRRSTP
jgi:hypothetical protein